VARVAVPSLTVNRSKTVLAVSAVSMCSQNFRLATVQSAGRVTDWVSVSVCVEP
jgi:hypothetical protein